MYLGECPKIEYGCHFHGNEPRENNYFDFFSIFFHTDHNKYTLYNEVSGLKNEQNSFSASTPPPLKSATTIITFYRRTKTCRFNLVYHH